MYSPFLIMEKSRFACTKLCKNLTRLNGELIGANIFVYHPLLQFIFKFKKCTKTASQRVKYKIIYDNIDVQCTFVQGPPFKYAGCLKNNQIRSIVKWPLRGVRRRNAIEIWEWTIVRLLRPYWPQTTSKSQVWNWLRTSKISQAPLINLKASKIPVPSPYCTNL